MEYFVLLLLLLFLSYYYDICRNRIGRNAWYYLVLFVMVLIAGLRWRIGADTCMYIRQFYHNTPYLWNLKIEDLTIGNYPFWTLLNSTVRTLGGRFYVVQLIHALFVNVLLFKYIKKHSPYLFTCIFFYAVLRFVDYNFEEMKATIGVVLYLYGNDYILDKKWIKGLALYMIGTFFHFSTALMTITPLFLLFRFNLFGVSVLVGTFVIGYFFNVLFGDYMNILEFDDMISSKAEHYVSGSGEKRSLYYVLIEVWVYVLYSIISLLYVKRYYPNNKILIFEPFLLLGIATLLLQANVRFFYRYTHFFSIYLIFFLSTLYVKIMRSGNNYSYMFSWLRTSIVFSPLMFAIFMHYRGGDNYTQYYPYSSIFERKVDRHRENRINRNLFRGLPYTNEY